MILQALCDYYDRNGTLAPEGFARVDVPFLVVIGTDGSFRALEDTRQPNGRTLCARPFLFPKPNARCGPKSYQVTHFLWDHIGYISGKGRAETEKEQALARAQHQTWLDTLDIHAKNHPTNVGIQAMYQFYATGQLAHLLSATEWTGCKKIPGCNLAFRLDGDLEPIPCLPSVRSIVGGSVSEASQGENIEIGICLVTGEQAPIARIHTRTPISKDSKSLVNFQKNSGYDSYGKEQGYNAPVSRRAEAAYTTALNNLLARDSKQKLQVGDATTVFWSGKRETELEQILPNLFGLPNKDDPDAETRAVASLYASPHTGHLPVGDDTPFFVLGLAPNAARIAVRFWHFDTVVGLSAKLRQHFDNLEIVKSEMDPGRRALMPLLCDLVLQGKADNIPPNLAGNVVRAVLTGGPYPATLLHMAVRRVRADKDYGVTRMRAAVLKAALNRANRLSSTPTQEITVSLDPTNICPGYRLGRLFAVLEKIQEDAQPGINATIRDRFYGAASSSPASVFPQLLKLKNHHLAKLENPAFRRSHEIRLTEIFDGLADMPAHLRLEEQARFAIGYYHQRQALFTKSPKPETAQA